MEKSGGSDGPDYAGTATSSQTQMPQDRPRRRFGLLSALVRFAVALALVGATLYLVSGWIAERPAPPQRMNRERTFTVEGLNPHYGTNASPSGATGPVAAARTSDVNRQPGVDSSDGSNLSKTLRPNDSHKVTPDYFGLKLTAPTN